MDELKAANRKLEQKRLREKEYSSRLEAEIDKINRQQQYKKKGGGGAQTVL